MEIKGKIILVMPLEKGISKAGKEWEKQNYVLETLDAQYPKKICFNIFGAERIQQANIAVGNDVLVSFDLESREFNGRWYTDVRAWKVDKLDAQAAGAPAPAPVDFFTAAPAGSPTDDLPF